jgi:hypothetical protein
MFTTTGAGLHCCMACALVLLPPAPAMAAQESFRGETVTTRPRPEVSPLGIVAGGFVILPRLTLATVYDDNVLATAADEQSGFRTEVSPGLAVHSDWRNHALNAYADANVGRNSEFSSENYEDWSVSVDGRLDVRRTVKLFGGIAGGHDHVDRTSPDDANGLEPTEYDHANIFGRYLQQFGRFSLRLDAAATRNDYQDVVGIRNGSPIPVNQDDRDRNEYRLSVRSGYEIAPDYEAYIRFTSDRRDYDDLQDVIHADRSSQGYEGVAGVALDLGGITFGDVFVGYLNQDYEAPFPDIGTPVFGTALYWNPSGLTTVSLAVQRSINEAINAGFSGYTRTQTSVVVDHELRRDLLLKAGIHYSEDEYAGVGPATRDDKTYDLHLGPTFLTSRYFHISLQYHYLSRESDDNTVTAGTSEKFDKNLLLIQLNTQL